jgi:hypothetical protein
MDGEVVREGCAVVELCLGVGKAVFTAYKKLFTA